MLRPNIFPILLGYSNARPRIRTNVRQRPWLPFSIIQPVSTLHSHAFSTSAISHSTSSLTHIDEHGQASMVDVGDKQPTKRTATAVGRIYIPRVAYELVISTYPVEKGHATTNVDKVITKARRKGDALTVAQLAAIMGAKKTSELIPLCHPLSLSKITVNLTPEAPKEGFGESETGRYSIICSATVSLEGKTGVEMEALTAVSVGLLTVWDMLKAVAGKEMEIGGIIVSHKSGGRSGDFHREV